MAVNMKKVGDRYSDHENRRGGFSSNFVIEGKSKGKNRRFILMMPPHKNMDEIPFVEFMYHFRDVPKDVKGAPFNIRCQRDNYDDTDFGKCWPCGRMVYNRKKRKEKGDEFDEKAGQFAPRRKPICQVIDVTPCFNNRGEFKRPLKKCFGKFNEMDDCEDCRFAEVCEKFVQKWYMPIKAWEQFNDHFMDEGDITDLDNCIPIRITRTGKGQYDTRYDTKAFSKSAMSLSKGIKKRIMKKLLDLTTEDPKPTAESRDELKKIYKDFYNLSDINIGDDDDDDDDDDVVRRPRKNKNKSKNKNKKKKNKDDIRKKMKRRARKGKLDRD